MARETHKSLRERLATVVELASSQGIPLRYGIGAAPYRAGSVDISSSGYGYAVEMLTHNGSSGVDLISPSGMTASECRYFLQGMAAALDLRRSLQHRGIMPRAIPQESDESRELAIYVENDSARWPTICKRLSKLYRAGSFSLDHAIAYIERSGCHPAARDYVLQHCGMGDTVAGIFPRPCRLAAAESLARGLVDEFKLGNFWE